MKKLAVFLRAVMAGFCIGLGGTVYLSLMGTSKPLGAFLFAIGLFLIFCYSLNLFTGKVGFVFDNGWGYAADLAVIWLGNLAGTFAVGLSLSFFARDGLASTWQAAAESLCRTKLADSPLSLLVLGIFCGFLMFVAADNWRRAKGEGQRLVGTFLPVAVFILCGFEHCVANMFYFAAAREFSFDALICLLVVTAGNALGSFILPLLSRAWEKIEKK